LDKLDKLEKFSRTMDILTKSEELRLIYGVVLKPNSEDLQGDVVSKDDIRQAAHDFLISSREAGISHQSPAPASSVESYLAPTDMALGNQKIDEDSWIIGIKVDSEEIWQAVKSGIFNSFSIGALAVAFQLANREIFKKGVG